MLMKQLNEKLFKNTKLIKTFKQKANVLDMILKQFPHVSNETASDYVTLNKTAKAPMEIETIPQTSQETTSGKNLLNIDNSEEGGIDASGAEVSGNTLWRGNEFIKVLPNTEYTFSSGVSMTLRLYQYDENYNFISPRAEAVRKTFLTITTGPSTKYLKFSIYGDGTHFTKQLVETYNLQIEQSSTVTSYEPCTGGIPAPNPDYPEEIHCTTGENQVKVLNGNLFSGWNIGEFYSATTGEKIILNDRASTDFIRIKIEDNYHIFNLPTATNSYICGYDKSFNFVARTAGNNSSNKTINKSYFTTIGSGTGNLDSIEYITISYLSATVRNDTCLSLENENTYIEHEETTYPISLGNKEMFNINGVYDGFVYDENEDKFYIERNNGKVILSENRNWTQATFSTGQLYYRGSPISDIKNNNNEVISNYFIAKEGWSVKSPGIWADTNNTIVTTQGSLANTETVDDFKSWLSTHNTIVVYQLANATLEEITDTTLISQLRAIKSTLSMQSTTHIISTATGENLPFLIKASAVKSFE